MEETEVAPSLLTLDVEDPFGTYHQQERKTRPLIPSKTNRLVSLSYIEDQEKGIFSLPARRNFSQGDEEVEKLNSCL